MSKKGYISRYLILLNKLRNDRYCSYQELANYLENQQELLRLGDESLEMAFSKRTLQRDFKEIRELFGIDIEYSRREKGYYIVQSQSENLNFQRKLEAFDMINSLSLRDDLNPIVKLENRKSSGTEHLYGLIHAIKNQLRISFTYHKFWEDKFTERTCNPYFIKEFRNRWYLIAKDKNDEIVKTFAFDRISNLAISNNKFTPEDISETESKFSNAFGINLLDNTQPEEVILSFTPFQGKYLKSLPLHESQEILVDDNLEVKLKLNVYVTPDFIMELLSYGSNLRVIKPAGLQKEIQIQLRKALEKYE